MTRNAAKQERERRIIEDARKHSRLFPPDELEMADNPDGRIPSARIAIEVSELLPEEPEGAMFSGPQLSEFQSEVVLKAAGLFSDAQGRPSDVLVFFNNDWDRKRDPEEMALALADFVANNYPEQSKTVCLQKGGRAAGWVDGLSVVRITAEGGKWQAGGSGDGVTLTYEQLASRIAAKSERTEEYRRRLPGWEIWLLLATRVPVLWSVSLPLEITSWHFTCGFDRVLLSSWEDGVLQLNCTNDSAEVD
ncbi:MAG TPA: hypothetical protein VFE06_10045 [Acidobacteriaceae bacterium]|jgi:hypothetical protein|nr:hypothetical protein [Acidobacteriaceae bacterium]